jgi:hypothetical protein
MASKKDKKKSPGKTGENDSRSDSVFNVFDLMEQWYAGSNEMMQFMMKTFTLPGKEPEKDKENGRGAKNHSKERLNQWQGYIENMESLMKNLSVVPDLSKDQMELMYQNWKEFQNAISQYFSTDKQTDTEWGIPTEIWNRWFEYANSMNRQLFRGFYDVEPGESMKRPISTMTGSKIKTGVPLDNIGQLDEKSMNEINEIFSRYSDEVTREFIAANEAVMFNNESVVERSKDFFEKWVGSYDRFMKELIRTRSFNVLLNDNLKLQLDTRKQMDEAFEDHWKLLGLPTRTDVMELHRTMHDMQLKLNRLQKEVNELNGKNK